MQSSRWPAGWLLACGTKPSAGRHVTPLVEFRTFGRLDNDQKLEEVLPPARGDELVGEEKVAEDASPEHTPAVF